MVMVNEYGRWYRWFIRNLGLFVKNFLPTKSPFKRLGIGGARNNDAAGYVTGVQWLEGRLRIHVGPLIPELNSHSFPINLKDF